MENFRPPAMEEVETQKRKKKVLSFSMIFIILLLVGVGSFIGIKNLRIYLNYLSIEKKYQLLTEYYKSLSSNDVEKLKKIAPEVVLKNNYNFINNNGDYSLYIFPNQENVVDNSMFVIVDNSVVPNIPHLKQVTYGKSTEGEVVIQEILELAEGSQID